MIFRLSDSGFARAIGAAIERVPGFDAMPYDPAAAVSADWSQLLYCAFEAVEDVLFARRDHLERQIIIVPTNFTFGHVYTSIGLIGLIGLISPIGQTISLSGLRQLVAYEIVNNTIKLVGFLERPP
jgi:hypothetical protein